MQEDFNPVGPYPTLSYFCSFFNYTEPFDKDRVMQNDSHVSHGYWFIPNCSKLNCMQNMNRSQNISQEKCKTINI